jgi:hypothetical protein
VSFRSYLAQLFERPRGEHALLGVVRNFSNGSSISCAISFWSEALKYFYEKSGSTILFCLHQFALLVLLLYCLSYADQWYLDLFSFLDNKRLAHRLNRAVNISIAVGLFFAIWWGSSIIVTEISRAQL